MRDATSRIIMIVNNANLVAWPSRGETPNRLLDEILSCAAVEHVVALPTFGGWPEFTRRPIVFPVLFVIDFINYRCFNGVSLLPGQSTIYECFNLLAGRGLLAVEKNLWLIEEGFL